MTREDRMTALKKALQRSLNGSLTFVLLKGEEIYITQNIELAKHSVRNRGYKVYAKCKEGYMIL